MRDTPTGRVIDVQEGLLQLDVVLCLRSFFQDKTRVGALRYAGFWIRNVSPGASCHSSLSLRG